MVQLHKVPGSMFLEPVTCVFLKVVHDPKRKKKNITGTLPSSSSTGWIPNLPSSNF